MPQPEAQSPTGPPGEATAENAPSFRRRLKAILVVVILAIAVTAFASWYWTGDWMWMFNPR